LVAVVAVLAVVAVPGAPAEPKNSEQVVFSGVGPGSTSFFGFWIWCEGESENPYAGVCQGSMYFYDLGLTKHVVGWVSEPEEGVYQMNVFSTLDGSVSCTLSNDIPVLRGPRNTVHATCDPPSGFTGESTNAVVVVTGP
jgi:hypothetical protein